MINRNHYKIHEIEERLSRVEEHCFGKKIPPSTTKQQMLLLKFTGLLDHIVQFNAANEDKYKIIGKILNRDKDSIKKAYRQIAGNDDDIFTPSNLQFVIDTFESNGLGQLAERPRKILGKVEVKWAKPDNN